MRYKTLTFLFVLLLFTSPLSAYQERNLLSDNWDEEALSGLILPPGEWSPYPSIDQRASWENLPEGIKIACIKAGEEALDFKWPTLPATVFMEFHLNGNRSNYQDIRGARRYALSDLVLAELIENKGLLVLSIAIILLILVLSSFLTSVFVVKLKQ